VGFKGLITATAAVALMAAPTVAAAQSVEVAPASETVSEGSELRGGFIIPLIAIIAIILGILAATNDDDDDLPKSP
jgi:glycerol uptake facilitator-like aquaporin